MARLAGNVLSHFDDALLDDALEVFDLPRIARRIAQPGELEVEEAANRLE